MQERNEQLAVKAAAISEEELEAVRAEAAQRVAAAERKVPCCYTPSIQLFKPSSSDDDGHGACIFQARQDVQ
jgi:hypothetical protein